MNTAITEEKVLNMLEKSGVHGMTNLAEGAEVTATFTPDKARAASWAEKHRADGSDSTSKAVNETVPDPQAVVDGTTVDMPFWGNYGSVNERDSLTLKLSSKQTVDMATLYFYNDRQTNGYSEPSKFAVEYWDGEAWQAVRQQTRTPSAPRANYNAVYFAPVETDQFRFTFTNKDKGFTAVTEIQLFNEGGDRDHPAQNTAPSVKLAEDTSMTGNLYTTLKATCTDDGMPYDKDILVRLIVKKRPGAFAYQAVRKQRTDLPTLNCMAAKLGGEYRVTVGARPGRAVLLRDDQGILADGVTEASAAAFAEHAAGSIRVSGNMWGSAEYRRALAPVLVRRALLALGEVR